MELRPGDPGYYSAGKPEALDWPERDPEPTVRSTDPRPADAPDERKPLRDLVGLARMAGWEVRVGYSRGHARQVRKGLYKEVHTFGVWGLGYGWRWCVMYEWSPDLKKPWTWDRTAIWSAQGGPVAPGLGSRFVDGTKTDLEEFLGLRGAVLPSWFKGVHARVQEAQEKAKAAAKSRPTTKKPKEGMA